MITDADVAYFCKMRDWSEAIQEDHRRTQAKFIQSWMNAITHTSNNGTRFHFDPKFVWPYNGTRKKDVY